MTREDDPDAGAREALRLIGPDPANWVPDRTDASGKPIDHNVLIVGGGQTGCAFAFALRRAGIGKVCVIDTAPDAERAGIWENGARMHVLRTPKTLPGPELGIAALSFQAWYEARHGADAYRAFERIPRQAWVDYLAWYRDFLGIIVRYGTRLDRIEPCAVAHVCSEEIAGPTPGNRPQAWRGDTSKARLASAPRSPSSHAWNDSAAMPSSRAGQRLCGLRGACIRAPFSPMPAPTASGAVSNTAQTLPIPARRSAKANARPGLPAADNQHVVVDGLSAAWVPVRHPVGRIGADQPQRFAGAGVRVVFPRHGRAWTPAT